MEEEQKERKNRITGIAVSVAMHVLLLVLFMFILAWREPDPPLPEYGIELNFGMEEQGSGEVQPETPVTEESTEEEAQPDEANVEEVPEEIIEEAVEAIEPVEEVVEEVVEQPVPNKQESPEVIKEVKETPKEEVKPKPVEKKEEKKPEPVKTEPVKTEQTTGAKEEGKADTPAKKSEGDDAQAVGDKGEPEGELNADAIYKGKPGGGSDGPALNIVGWIWDEVPRKKDASSENGTITFEFTIDEDGYVIAVRTLQRSVSPSVAKFYEEQLQKTTFSRTGTGAIKPGNTKGTVTFNIVSR